MGVDPGEAARARLCVALDESSGHRITALADAIEPHVGVFKVGLTAFSALGPPVVLELAARRPVFLDLKLHDIPAQVEGAIDAVVRLGATYTTVHASGGADMVKAAVAAAGDAVVVLGVTVLTSIDAVALERIGIGSGVTDHVVRLAEIAIGAGARGLVCSPREIGALRARFGPSGGGGPVLAVPGIRATDAPEDDQKRTLSAREAVDAGADVVVVGRPITRAPDPGAAAKAVLAEIGR